MSNNTLSTIINSFFEEDSFAPIYSPITRAVTSLPAVNILETENQYQIQMLASGIKPEEIKVQIEDKVLTISYSHKEENTGETGKQYLRREWKSTSFTRSVILTKDVDKESILAEYENGILTIKINKKPEVQPQKIEVKIKKNE